MLGSPGKLHIAVIAGPVIVFILVDTFEAVFRNAATPHNFFTFQKKAPLKSIFGFDPDQIYT